MQLICSPLWRPRTCDPGPGRRRGGRLRWRSCPTWMGRCSSAWAGSVCAPSTTSWPCRPASAPACSLVQVGARQMCMHDGSCHSEFEGKVEH